MEVFDEGEDGGVGLRGGADNGGDLLVPQAAAGQQPALPGDEEVPVPPLRVLADGDGAKKPVLGDALCQDIQFRQVEIPAGLVGAGEDAPYWK